MLLRHSHSVTVGRGVEKSVKSAFGSAVTVAEAIGSFGASLGSIRREPKLISLEVFMKQEDVMMQL